jgi:hypothetical protein
VEKMWGNTVRRVINRMVLKTGKEYIDSLREMKTVV